MHHTNMRSYFLAILIATLAKLWDIHSPEDNIGKDLASSLLNYAFIIDNNGNPTYNAHKCRTAPDLTAHRGDIIIHDWQQQEPIRKSHHNIISYNIVMPFASLPMLSTPPTHQTYYSQPSSRWSHINWIQFNARVNNILSHIYSSSPMPTDPKAQVHFHSKALTHAITIASKTHPGGMISHPKQWCTPQLVKLLH